MRRTTATTDYLKECMGTALLELMKEKPIEKISIVGTSHLTVRGKIANLFDKDYETVYGYQTAGREYTLSGSYTF